MASVAGTLGSDTFTAPDAENSILHEMRWNLGPEQVFPLALRIDSTTLQTGTHRGFTSIWDLLAFFSVCVLLRN